MGEGQRGSDRLGGPRESDAGVREVAGTRRATEQCVLVSLVRPPARATARPVFGVHPSHRPLLSVYRAGLEVLNLSFSLLPSLHEAAQVANVLPRLVHLSLKYAVPFLGSS